jgi:hypothetical protein
MSMGGLRGRVVSSSVWAGGQSPVILSVTDAMGMPLDAVRAISVRLVGQDGRPVGADVPAVAIRPAGETQVSYVATLDIPQPGPWRLDLLAADGATGSVTVDALDQGASARLGAPLQTSTPDPGRRRRQPARRVHAAPGRPAAVPGVDRRRPCGGRSYVLVVDSARFGLARVRPGAVDDPVHARPVAGRLVRPPEPFEYQIVTGEPVLSGDLANPPLNHHAGARAWAMHLAGDPDALDLRGRRNGCRAKYTGSSAAPTST